MFWLKQYCNHFDLQIIRNSIYENKTKVGHIDLYEDIVYFTNDTRCLSKDLAVAMVENFKLHGVNE